MPFTLVQPRKLDVGEVSPFGGILQNALKSYNDITQSQYLDSNLAQALQKAKLYNQYYGPDIQSQIDLKGAQTQNYGALTRGQNITNTYLPDRLKAELQKLQYDAQTKAIFNALLKRKQDEAMANSASNQQSSNIASPDSSLYTAGQGLPPYNPEMNAQDLGGEQSGATSQQSNVPSNQQPVPAHQPQMPMVVPRTQGSSETESNPYYQDLSNQQAAPEPTIDDLLNKHFFKTDTFTPKLSAYNTQRNAIKEATNKQLMAIQNDAPTLVNDLKDKLYIQQKIKDNPDWFGPGILGFDIHGPSYRERHITDPEHGVLTDKFNTLVGKAMTHLSSKPLAASLNYSIKNKVGFNNTPQEALGRTQGVTENDARSLKQADDFYYAKTGKHVLKPADRALIQKAFDSLEKNKVNVYYGGKKHRVPRSQLDNFRGKKGVRIEE